MGLILVRYGELALKSRRVRLRFERALMRNIEEMFMSAGLECLTSREWGRIFLRTADDKGACTLLRRVFGVTSFSPAVECSSDAGEISGLVAERSRTALRDGQTFAVRARRTGTHPYTSQELAAMVGREVLRANEGRGVRVDLTAPDVEFFVEVRQKRAFVFVEKLPGPGGLPLGTQGRVVALLDGENGAAAAWLMMKRGCRVIAVAPEMGELGAEESPPPPEIPPTLQNPPTPDPLRQAATSAPMKHAGAQDGPRRALDMLLPWAPGLVLHRVDDVSVGGLASLARRRKAAAIVLGLTYDELERGIPVAPIPVLFPLCGMSGDEIRALVARIREA
ncbi:MAG: THUMP domain-containing protein [Thermoplasmata archaeon]